ncbi:MAG: hypothetical protein U0V87_16040 [Acidobacteriota bacterium]
MSRLKLMLFGGVAASAAFPAAWLLLAAERPVGGDLLKLSDPPSEAAQIGTGSSCQRSQRRSAESGRSA